MWAAVGGAVASSLSGDNLETTVSVLRLAVLALTPLAIGILHSPSLGTCHPSRTASRDTVIFVFRESYAYLLSIEYWYASLLDPLVHAAEVVLQAGDGVRSRCFFS